jgi:hypothetical protein
MLLRSIAVTLILVACSSPAPTPPPPGPMPAPPTLSSRACVTDADCRLEDAAGCTCIGAHVLDPLGPGCPHPCFAPPCLSRVPSCDAASHRCVPRATTVPVPPDDPPTS